MEAPVKPHYITCSGLRGSWAVSGCGCQSLKRLEAAENIPFTSFLVRFRGNGHMCTVRSSFTAVGSKLAKYLSNYIVASTSRRHITSSCHGFFSTCTECQFPHQQTPRALAHAGSLERDKRGKEEKIGPRPRGESISIRSICCSEGKQSGGRCRWELGIGAL